MLLHWKSFVAKFYYFLLKSNLAIFFVISFNCRIGSVNFFDTYDAINDEISIVIAPIHKRVLFEIWTLSSIGTTWILIYKIQPFNKS